MVANYRCNEIKDEALAKVAQTIQNLKINSNKNLIDNFKDECETIVKESLTFYDEEAHQYEKKVFSKLRGEIELEINKDLLFCFDS